VISQFLLEVNNPTTIINVLTRQSFHWEFSTLFQYIGQLNC
jgi:hypothetical protein